jgi:peptidoglycan pentaglycine glycine transferase (the first glycine)
MKFNPNIEKEKYIEFEEKSSKAHFMQTYAWGQFAIKGKKQKPLYVGMEDDNGNILCEALFLKKNTPLGYSYIYCPRGYVIDFNNIELLKEFTSALKNYMRENKIIYIKIDPDLKYEDIDEEAKPLKDGFNNYKLFNSLLDLGYIHKGFYKLYEGNQPRYTFRIDLTKSKDEIDNNISKSFLKSVKRSYNYNLEIDNETNIDLFCELNKYNSSKDDFKPYSKEYYEEFTKQFIEAKAVKYFNAWINKKEVLDNLNNQLSELNEKIKIDTKHTADLNNQITRVKQDIDTFSKLEKDKEMVCSLICVYAGDKAWSLYIGSNDIANTTFAVSRCYYDSIMDAKENGYKIYDLFGTVGDPHTNFKNLAHLHDYKRKFGGEYIEFMGEFDLVNNKFLYNILPILLKIYRSIKK